MPCGAAYVKIEIEVNFHLQVFDNFALAGDLSHLYEICNYGT